MPDYEERYLQRLVNTREKEVESIEKHLSKLKPRGTRKCDIRDCLELELRVAKKMLECAKQELEAYRKAANERLH